MIDRNDPWEMLWQDLREMDDRHQLTPEEQERLSKRTPEDARQLARKLVSGQSQ